VAFFFLFVVVSFFSFFLLDWSSWTPLPLFFFEIHPPFWDLRGGCFCNGTIAPFFPPDLSNLASFPPYRDGGDLPPSLPPLGRRAGRLSLFRSFRSIQGLFFFFLPGKKTDRNFFFFPFFQYQMPNEAYAGAPFFFAGLWLFFPLFRVRYRSLLAESWQGPSFSGQQCTILSFPLPFPFLSLWHAGSRPRICPFPELGQPPGLPIFSGTSGPVPFSYAKIIFFFPESQGVSLPEGAGLGFYNFFFFFFLLLSPHSWGCSAVFGPPFFFLSNPSGSVRYVRPLAKGRAGFFFPF